MIINMIVAYDEHYAIGNNNQLLFHIKKDLKRFKELTTNSTVLMGRKTYESLPENKRPLPNRHNIILTRSSYNIHNPNVSVLNTIEQVLEYAASNDIWIIGGASIYGQFLPYTDHVYVTRILNSKPADTWFPYKELLNEFEVKEIETHQEDSNTIQFIKYSRS